MTGLLRHTPGVCPEVWTLGQGRTRVDAQVLVEVDHQGPRECRAEFGQPMDDMGGLGPGNQPNLG